MNEWIDGCVFYDLALLKQLENIVKRKESVCKKKHIIWKGSLIA